MTAAELRTVAIGLALLLAAGCAQHVERAVLLPSADRGPGEITFTTRAEDKTFKITRPHEVIDISEGVVTPGSTNEAAVLRRYGAIAPARPPLPARPAVASLAPPAAPTPPPTQYLLYFRSRTSDFTLESRATFELIKKRLQANPKATVIVIGHTDRAGSDKRNDALSLRRAQAVRNRLIAEGVAGNRIETFGRGEREPLVQTADGVAEPKNRRVEITIR